VIYIPSARDNSACLTCVTSADHRHMVPLCYRPPWELSKLNKGRQTKAWERQKCS